MLPRYFSTAPVPSMPTGQFSVLAKLPKEFQKNEALAATKLVLKVADTVMQAIEMTLRKCQDGLNPDNFIFKVVGKGEYVYGTKEKMMDFEYVRYCIRHSQDISFALIYVPPEKRCVTPYPIEWLNPVQYANTFFSKNKKQKMKRCLYIFFFFFTHRMAQPRAVRNHIFF